MVAKVTQYLQDVLAPTLNHFHVPAAYARQIIDTVELQMISFCDIGMILPFGEHYCC